MGEGILATHHSGPSPVRHRALLLTPFRLVLVFVLFLAVGSIRHLLTEPPSKHHLLEELEVAWAAESQGGNAVTPLPVQEEQEEQEDASRWFWERFPKLSGYYNGLQTLVHYELYAPENPDNLQHPLGSPVRDAHTPPMSVRIYDPYPDYSSAAYLQEHRPVNKCYIDADGKIAPPSIFHYPGVPQDMPYPAFGSYEELGIPEDVCFERFGRYGPYGYGYSPEDGGISDLSDIEQEGIDEIWLRQSKINYTDVSWAAAQEQCVERNKHRFNDGPPDTKREPRTAVVIRDWSDHDYSHFDYLNIRAMVNELSLKTGGEFDIHILYHVLDESLEFWKSDEVYQEILQRRIPEEFRGLVTLWSLPLIKSLYLGPFDNNVENFADQDIYSVYRSGHWPLQWFQQQHPEYDFIWNWEVDLRYTGHYQDLKTISAWAKRQPRKGMWERSSRFWIPGKHGDWAAFTKLVEEETAGQDSVWGPVEFPNSGMLASPPETTPPWPRLEDDYEWGVGEEADLIVLDPLYDPSKTEWVFRQDITGYDLDLPIPPRRAAIVTASRLSKRLLDLMRAEASLAKHSAFTEMWPATCALHHGLKAVYAPHPVHFDRKWPLDRLDQAFNHPRSPDEAPFSPAGEHVFKGCTFYYNAEFGRKLWNRWLGRRLEDRGGRDEERDGSGRMCFRPLLHHPIKPWD